MEILNQYFDGIIFQFIEVKQSYAIYVAAIQTRIGGDQQQYVIAFVPEHLGVQNKSSLGNLPWKNLQTRLCKIGTYKVQPQPWRAPIKDVPDITFSVTERNERYSVYRINTSVSNIDFPFEVLMINSSKKKSKYQYPNSMNLHYCIDQFQTIFNYIGRTHPIYLSSPVNSSDFSLVNTPLLLSGGYDSTHPLYEWSRNVVNTISNTDVTEFL